MLSNKLWLSNDIQEERAKELSERAGISVLLAKVFLSRGMSDVNQIKSFLNPELKDMHDPFLMKDMDAAVNRITAAISEKERILVYGDYDVDGTTSTSILIDFFARQGVKAAYYIPDRLEEGYGLSIEAIDKINEAGTDLIITVDCGITAVEEVKYAVEKGMDIIVTDHHQCKEQLPEAIAVIDPCRPDCTYPFKYLAGVGVAYKLVTALCIKLGLGDMYNEYLDIVSVGTVADVVPLTGENRIIVKYGLELLEKTKNEGLKALLSFAGYKDKALSSFGISFGLAPRINAAGRLGDASRAVRLFNSKDPSDASSIAQELNEENKFRQDTESWIMGQAIEIIESTINFEREKVIVVAGKGWHHGVIGIVASKITERYYRPCILLTDEDGVCKGSARSIEGFNLFEALTYCKDILEKFGGHELAAGLTVKEENLGLLRSMINSYADEILSEEDLVPKLKIDTDLDKRDITMENVRDLELLAPFGAGNPGPVFLYRGLRIEDIRTVGENKHLKLKLSDGKLYADAIGFNMGAIAQDIKYRDLVDAACALEINVWNSVEKIQLNLKDVKISRLDAAEPSADSGQVHLIRDTNKRKQLELSFYSSLHHCMASDADGAEGIRVENLLSTAGKIDGRLELIDKLEFHIKRGESVALLANDIECTELLEYNLGNTRIKKHYRLFCNVPEEGAEEKIHIILNPVESVVDFSSYKAVIICGSWVDMCYLKGIINRIDNSRLFLYNIGVHDFSSGYIIPERKDLAAIFQYIKSKPARINDINTAADNISKNCKLAMNYFKFRQGLEIFEELGLLQKEYDGLYGVSIALAVNGKTKLENSSTYKRLQALKGQLKGG